MKILPSTARVFAEWNARQALARSAYAVHLNEIEAPKQKRTGPMPCGTPAAWRCHRRHGERPCVPCQSAQREYERDRTAARRLAAKKAAA
ncbi:hypothetical protein GCM10009719_17000 [Nocardioides kribbensis]